MSYLWKTMRAHRLSVKKSRWGCTCWFSFAAKEGTSYWVGIISAVSLFKTIKGTKVSFSNPDHEIVAEVDTDDIVMCLPTPIVLLVGQTDSTRGEDDLWRRPFWLYFVTSKILYHKSLQKSKTTINCFCLLLRFMLMPNKQWAKKLTLYFTNFSIINVKSQCTPPLVSMRQLQMTWP